jgi:putative endonuclease
MEKQPAVYITGKFRNGAIYTGVTSNLMQRLYQHRECVIPGFTKKHGLKRLVWFEMHASIESAILREKQIKNWKRKWKLALFEDENPTWRDLAEDLGFDPLD